jgi:chemotaxis protein MotB
MRATLSVMRTVVVLFFCALLAACAGGGYWAYKSYRGLEADLRLCAASESAQRAQLGIRSAELESLRRENQVHQVELATLEQWKTQNARLAKQMAAFNEVTAKLQKMIDTGKLRVLVRDGRMILKLPAEVLFSSGRAELSATGRTTLTEVADVLKQFPSRSFMVAGHTDNEPVKDSGYRNNWQLSTERALTVTEFFIENGMKAQNLVAAGYGEFDPIASNASGRGRQDNRRIELVLLPNVEELPRLIEETKQLTASSAAGGK